MENLQRRMLSVLGGALFFGLTILLMQPSPYNIFFWFLISLPNYFPISHIIYLFVFFIFAYSFLFVMAEGSLVDDKSESTKISEDQCKPIAISATVAFFFVLIFFTIIGKKLQLDFSVGCYSLFCQSSNNMTSVGDGFIYAVSGLLNLAFIVGFPVSMVAIGAAAGAAFPTFLAGIIALSQHNKFEAAIKRTLPLDRPDRAIERELAQIMRNNLVNEQQVEEMISRLSPFNQWVRRIQYRKRLQDARRLREMAKAKYGALGEEADLALKIHDIEGSRRERDDWRQMR